MRADWLSVSIALLASAGCDRGRTAPSVSPPPHTKASGGVSPGSGTSAGADAREPHTGGPPIAVAVTFGPKPCWHAGPVKASRCVDADGDGFDDGDDACPDEAEVFNGNDDRDGCPDDGDSLVRVDEARGVIELRAPVEFEPNKAVIVRESFAVLDHVVSVMMAYHRFATIEVQAHDKPREERYGMRITDKRARAVRDYLVSRGIDPARITTQGYGEERPIDTNRTALGRRRNQRIEIHIREYAPAE